MVARSKYLLFFSLLTALLQLALQCGAPQQDGETGPADAGPLPPVESAEALVPITLPAGEKLRVVATTSIVADIVKNVGGELIEVSLLLPLGTDPHAFEPTPGDLATVADAHLIFANGMGLEQFLDKMIENAGGTAAIVTVSDGIEPRQLGQEKIEEQAEAHEQDLKGVDPHTWTSPANGLIFVQNIERALKTIDPANAGVYEANAAAYQAQLEELDAWVKQQIDTIPPENRELVTDHTVFGYYADRYGLQQVGAIIPAFSTISEPSARELAELENAIRASGVKAVFVGATVTSAMSERLAEDTGLKLLRLYTGSLGQAGSGVESYLDYITYNTNTIVEGLR